MLPLNPGNRSLPRSPDRRSRAILAPDRGTAAIHSITNRQTVGVAPMTPRIVFVLGTRPEIVKLAPLIRACDRAASDYAVVHTGQHYSERLDGVFFDDLELPAPEHNLEVGSGDHAAQTGE